MFVKMKKKYTSRATKDKLVVSFLILSVHVQLNNVAFAIQFERPPFQPAPLQGCQAADRIQAAANVIVRLSAITLTQPFPKQDMSCGNWVQFLKEWKCSLVEHAQKLLDEEERKIADTLILLAEDFVRFGGNQDYELTFLGLLPALDRAKNHRKWKMFKDDLKAILSIWDELSSESIHRFSQSVFVTIHVYINLANFPNDFFTSQRDFNAVYYLIQTLYPLAQSVREQRFPTRSDVLNYQTPTPKFFYEKTQFSHLVRTQPARSDQIEHFLKTGFVSGAKILDLPNLEDIETETLYNHDVFRVMGELQKKGHTVHYGFPTLFVEASGTKRFVQINRLSLVARIKTEKSIPTIGNFREADEDNEYGHFFMGRIPPSAIIDFIWTNANGKHYYYEKYENRWQWKGPLSLENLNILLQEFKKGLAP